MQRDISLKPNTDYLNDTMLSGYPDVLCPADVQKILQTGRNTTYKLLASGALRSLLIGGRYRIPKRYLIDYLYPDQINKD